MNGWAAFARRYETTLAFSATFLLFLCVHQYHAVSKFYWDAGGYWDLSALKNLLHFPNELRGYFYPALLAPIRLLEDMFSAGGHMPFRVISSALYAYVFSSLLPEFFVTCFGGRPSLPRRLAAPLLLSIFMPGVLIYPLSDLLGAATASIPQMLINLRHHDIASPAVATSGSGSNLLFAAQFLWGITAQKYETSVNPASPGAGLFYMDRAGEKFFAEHEIDGRNFSVTAYMKLMLHKPF